MPERFTNFVLNLAQDPRSLRQFQLQPDALMADAGLTAAEQAVMLSNDPALIRNALAADTSEEGVAAATTFVLTAVIVIHTHLEE